MAAGLSQAQICDCFNRLFAARYRVQLRGGGVEPDYLPPTQLAPGALIAREDFAASALHEAAHWCVASTARRAQIDYGYVYLPPPRSAAEQQQFFASELRNQAVELYLSAAAGVPFRASADDPDLGLAQLEAFEEQVRALTAQWEGVAAPPLLVSAPPRAVVLAVALSAVRESHQSGVAGEVNG